MAARGPLLNRSESLVRYGGMTGRETAAVALLSDLLKFCACGEQKQGACLHSRVAEACDVQAAACGLGCIGQVRPDRCFAVCAGSNYLGAWLKCPVPYRTFILALLENILLVRAPAFTHVLQLSAAMKSEVGWEPQGVY